MALLIVLLRLHVQPLAVPGPQFVFGGADPAIPNRYLHPQLTAQHLVQAAQTKIPNCTAEIFPMAGHYLPVEYPQELASKIQNFG